MPLQSIVKARIILAQFRVKHPDAYSKIASMDPEPNHGMIITWRRAPTEDERTIMTNKWRSFGGKSISHREIFER